MQGNEENLKETLFKVKEVLEENNVKFLIVGGTLLGAYRDKRMLPWDDDVDIAVIFKSYEEFADFDMFTLLHKIREKGFVDVRWGHDYVVDTNYFRYPELANSGLSLKEQWREFLKIDKKWPSGRFAMYWKGPAPPIEGLISALGWVHVDCQPFVNSVEGFHTESYNYLYNEDVLGKFDKVEIYGEVFYTPPDILKYIERYYGTNWKEIYCSTGLWRKHYYTLRKGIIPGEIEDFMAKWKVWKNGDAKSIEERHQVRI